MSVFEVYKARHEEYECLGMFATKELAESAARRFRDFDRREYEEHWRTSRHCCPSWRDSIDIKEHEIQNSYLVDSIDCYYVFFKGREQVEVVVAEPWVNKYADKIKIEKEIYDPSFDYRVELFASSKEEASLKAAEIMKDL